MADASSAPVLAIAGLAAWYGESKALHGVTLRVARGEVVTLVGRNGAGKTTTLRSIMGLLPRREGSVRIDGTEVVGCAPDEVARLGVGYCPEERGIFASLTVDENLSLPPVLRPGGLGIEEVYALFPNLRVEGRRSGTLLSGGEQQMLAIGRILRTGAHLLLLDEPTEGLAPVIVQQIGAAIGALKARGFTILLVEQNLAFAMSVSDRLFVLDEGVVRASVERPAFGDAATLSQIRQFLGV